VIPPFGLSGALPPFIGKSAVEMSGVSPYFTSMGEIAISLATSPERAKLLEGLLEQRKALRNLGVIDAIQWIDGSFCEDVERTRGRPPGDIDLVTLLLRPAAHQTDAEWAALIGSNLSIFNSQLSKAKYHCDSYFIDLSLPLPLTLSQVTYWFGLFTHQRTTALWKGILQVPLLSDDVLADAHVKNALTPALLTGPP
jgi:hypothetical protein